MNIPVISVSDAQQESSAGAIQSVTAGSVAGALHDDFAITFGATLRQSEPRGDAQMPQAKAEEVGARSSAQLATGGLVAAKGSRPGVSGGASLKAASVDTAIESDRDSAVEGRIGDLVPATIAKSDESSGSPKTVSESRNVYGSPTASQVEIIEKFSTKITVPGARLHGLVTSSKATGAAKTTQAIQAMVSREPLISGIDSGAALDRSLAKAVERGTDTLLNLVQDGSVATSLTTTQALDKLARVASVDVRGPAPARSVTAESAIPADVTAKSQTATRAPKPAQGSAESVVLDAVKARAPGAAPAFLNASASASAPVPLIPPTADGLAIQVGFAGTDSRGIERVQRNTGPDPAYPGAGIKADLSAPEPSVSGLPSADHGSDDATPAESDTDVGNAAQEAFASVTKTRLEAASNVQDVSATLVTLQSAIGTASADKTLKNIRPEPPNSKVAAIAENANGPRQSAFQLNLTNFEQTTESTGLPGFEGAAPVNQADEVAATPGKTVAKEAAESHAGEAEAARAGSNGPVFQTSIDRAKQAAADPATQQAARSESPVDVSAAPITTTGHASEREALNIPFTVSVAVTTPAATGPTVVQSIPQAAAGIAAPHLVASASQASVTASLSHGVSTGHAAGLSNIDASLPSEPYRTIAATPTALEVGVPNGTQGWLRIRAEVGDQGAVNASLAAGSNAGQEMLHRQLPALNAYLHSEQIPVTTSVADRVFAASGGDLAGMSTGSDASGRSLGHDAAGNQNTGGQSDATTTMGSRGGGTLAEEQQRDPRPIFDVVRSNDLHQSYHTRAGTDDVMAVRIPRDGESGRWLNVRA